jgi:beta-phosphoglucomutase
MLQAVIFDMDGVIIDSHPVHRMAWQQFLLTLGRNVSDQELDCILEGWRREDILRHFLGELSEAQIRELGSRKDEFFQRVKFKVRPIAGVREFLSHLEEKGIIRAVATSASEKRTRNTLSRLRLTRHFAAIITANDVPRGKPDPAVYRAAASQINIHPKDALVIEDSVAGIKAARSAGMRCVALASNGRGDILRHAGAEAVIPDFVGLTMEHLEVMLSPAMVEL